MASPRFPFYISRSDLVIVHCHFGSSPSKKVAWSGDLGTCEELKLPKASDDLQHCVHYIHLRV